MRELTLIRHLLVKKYRESHGEAGDDKQKLMDLSPAVSLLTSSPLRDCVAINRGRVEKKQVIKRKHRSTAERIC